MSTIRKPRRTPSYRLHKPSGQAVVTLDGRDCYLGPHGSQASRDRYDALIGEYLAHGRRLPMPESSGPTVAELLLGFWRWAQQHYRRADGTPTSEISCLQVALRVVRRMYPDVPAREFGPVRLKAVRQAMIEKGWARRSINLHVGRIRRVFKWGVENELVPAETHQALLAVAGLQAGRSEARETDSVRPVPDAHVDAVLPLLTPPVAAVVQLMRLTAMRVGEVVSMRTGDIDRSGDIWLYRPRRHKTAHRGKSRVIPLGPRAQEVVRPFLRAAPDAFLFQPTEGLGSCHPEEAATHRRSRKPRQCYDAGSIRRAIARACARAGVPQWHPHQLRHAAATSIRKQFGLEAARVLLGHSGAAIVELYAEADVAAAADLMSQVG